MNEIQCEAMLNKLKLVLTNWCPSQIDSELVSIWCDVLSKFSDDNIRDAYKHAIHNLTNWPSPAEFSRFCKGSTLDDKETGQEIATRIETSIGTFGYSNPTPAEIYIGNIGWEVVKALGGWDTICNVKENEIVSARKRWREISEIVSKNLHTKNNNSPPLLPMGCDLHLENQNNKDVLLIDEPRINKSSVKYGTACTKDTQGNINIMEFAKTLIAEANQKRFDIENKN